MSDIRVLFAASALTLLALSGNASAADAKTHYASRDQLRSCLDQQAVLKVRLRTLTAASDERTERAKRLEAEGLKLREMKTQVDRDNVAAITAFKALLTDYNANAAALNKEGADAMVATDAYNADSAALNDGCMALSYHSVDMDAVLKERRKAEASGGGGASTAAVTAAAP